MKRLILSLIFLGLTGLAVASTQNSLKIIKRTTLTGKDAARFSHKFGTRVLGNHSLNYNCKSGTCIIYNSRNGFTGKIAKQLLNKRKAVKFVSTDKSFTLECGKSPIAYCNIIQKKVVLN